MKKTQQTRSLSPVILRALTCCCLVLALAACGARRSEQARADGDTYLQLGKIDEAQEAYARAIEANPENPLAHLGLARCAANADDADTALQHFQEAYSVRPDLEPAYVEATELLLDNDRVNDAREVAATLTKAEPAAGHILQAYVERRSGDLDAALTVLEDARESFPESAAVRVALATTYLAAERPEDAEAVLRDLLDSTDAGNLTARMTLVEAYRQQGKTDEMLAEFEQMVEQNPDNNGMRLALAQALLYAGRLDEAEDIAHDIKRQQTAPGWADFVLGACLVERGEYEKAMPYLADASQALPDQEQVARMLDYAKSGGAVDATPTSKPRVQQATPESADWRTLWQQAALGELLLRRDEFLANPEPNLLETLVLSAYFTFNAGLGGELAEGLPENSPVRKFSDAIQNRDGEALRDFGETWPEEDDPDRKLLRDNAVAFAYTTLGARTRAIQQFAQIIRDNPDNAVALLNTAQVFRAAKIPKFASRVLQRLIAQYPHNINAHALLYVTLREGGMLEEAHQAAETTYAIFTDSSIAYLNLAQAYASEGEFELAATVLQRALEAFEEKAPFQVLLAGVRLESGAPEKCLQILSEIDEEAADSSKTALMEALALALTDNWPRVLEIVDGSAKDTLLDESPLLVATAYMHADRAEDAIRVLEAGEGEPMPGGLAGRIILGTLDDTQQPDDEEAQDLVRRLAESPGLAEQFALAAACQAEKLPDAAVSTLEQVGEAIPDNRVLTYMQATNLGASKRLEDKLQVARDFAESHASEPIAWLVLADVCQAAGDVEGEGTATAKAVEVQPDHVQALFRRGRYLEKADDLPAAVEVYRRIVELRPDDPAANNNLAYLLLLTGGDTNEALQRAQTASEVLRADASVRHTLGVCQLRTGDYENSRQNLGMALELRPGDPTLLLDYGLLLRAQGNEERAEDHLRLALSYADLLDLDFPRRAEAEEALGIQPRQDN